MKLNKYDSRAKAEQGIFIGLTDPYTGVKIENDGQQPGFMVRGIASHTAQQALGALAARAAAEKAAARAAADGTDAPAPVGTKAPLEQLHATQIDAAMPYIIRAVNIEDDDGEIGDDMDRIRRVLEMTFPELGYVTEKDEDGKERQTIGTVNKTFASQVTEVAEDGLRFLENNAEG